MSPKMLALARAKLERHGEERVSLKLAQADALLLPLADKTIDAVTMAFGIRNMPDVPAALQEIRRVLRPGGHVLILEFSLPAKRVFRRLYLVYLRHVLPWLGGVVSGNCDAYGYLSRTIESFPYGSAFCSLLREAGFGDVTAAPLTFGIATLYVGVAT